MTPEQRIAQLEAEVSRLNRVIEDQARAAREHAEREAAETAKREARRRVNHQNYERRKAAKGAQTSDSDSVQTPIQTDPSSPLVPPSPSSNPSPSSPLYPPFSLEKPSAGDDAPPEAKAEEKPKKPRKEASGPNAELWRALEAEYEKRMGAKYASGNGGADASTVSWLLAQTTPPEAVRRWGLLLEWSKGGFPNVGGFVALRSHWNAPQVVGLAPVVKGSAVVTPAEDEKARLRRETWERLQREKAAKAAGGRT